MAIIKGTPGNDTLTGTNSADSIFGFAGNDILRGLGGNDRLFGGTGNDTLNGGTGIDTLNGGAGNDIYIVDSITDTIIDNSGTDTVRSSVSYTLGNKLENLTLTGTRAINGTGNNLNNIIVGNAANNYLVGGQRYSYNDNDTLYGGDGNDTLLGDDRYTSGNDVLYGGDGNDDLRGGYYSLINQDFRDTLYGGNGDDTLRGSDSRFGNANSYGDVLHGGKGNDTYILTSTGDTLIEAANSGIDTVIANFSYTLGSNLENLTLNSRATSGTGNNLNNIIIGNDLNNVLKGLAGSDRLSGGAGKDKLWGSSGGVREKDTLTGGTASDRFVLGNATQVFYDDRNPATDGRSSYALITDFNPNADVIQLQGTRSKYVLAASPSGLPKGTAIYINKPGSEPNELIAIIQGVTGLSLANDYFRFTAGFQFTEELNLADLNGKNGFKIRGINAYDYSGTSVSSAGDVNSDGFADIIIGAPLANSAGESYVVFGAEGFDTNLNLSTLDGTNGFRINSLSTSDSLGTSVSGAGDVNGDGIHDLIIGAPNANSAGESYVVFGKQGGFSANLNLSTLDGTNGFRIRGINSGDSLGTSVSGAGDINGDGLSDIVIGAPRANSAGESYVVFGAEGFDTNFNLSTLDGTNGFKIRGFADNNYSPSSISEAGDINGDGFGDLIIGASTFNGGYSYVVFGKPGKFSASLDLSTLNGTNGFKISGFSTYFSSNISVSGAGDVNGDGFDDLIVGSPSDGDAGFYRGATGKSYLVFGKAAGFTPSLDTSDFNGSNGIVINGIVPSDNSGNSVSGAGDVNGDGFDDLIIGASNADANWQQNAGESYVVFGRNFTGKVTHLGTANSDRLTGTPSNDVIIGGLGNDTLIGGLGADVLYGGAGNDTIAFDASDRRVKGGSGNDTLRVDGTGINLDLINLSNNKMSEFELIDLTGTGDNTLKLNRLELLNLSDTSNELIVKGNVGDTVTVLDRGWRFDRTLDIEGNRYNQYLSGIATLIVDTDITQTFT
ncbi:S-layer family protein [Chroococcidiopsis sp. TS-821]|uniref:beta strand repeat-containing protein n=1 Tax=Chroococcidiopsis sp. TS-821 TaxID=1378066 RepID=UPI000CEE234E|nr:FG-GAP repeat protein [Chroococcidiopsis sp. TS-821]PPS43889.1 hypothetical protein B1A85_07825 [Chroococcidiopsis sp. TS-821]